MSATTVLFGWLACIAARNINRGPARLHVSLCVAHKVAKVSGMFPTKQQLHTVVLLRPLQTAPLTAKEDKMDRTQYGHATIQASHSHAAELLLLRWAQGQWRHLVPHVHRLHHVRPHQASSQQLLVLAQLPARACVITGRVLVASASLNTFPPFRTARLHTCLQLRNSAWGQTWRFGSTKRPS
jgi:hypothetical protein